MAPRICCIYIYVPGFPRAGASWPPPADVFSGLAQQVESAKDCIECGECEDKCPYGLPIREMIKEHAELFHKEMTRAGLG